jgi:hypothetical protein
LPEHDRRSVPRLQVRLDLANGFAHRVCRCGKLRRDFKVNVVRVRICTAVVFESTIHGPLVTTPDDELDLQRQRIVREVVSDLTALRDISRHRIKCSTFLVDVPLAPRSIRVLRWPTQGRAASRTNLRETPSIPYPAL